MKKLLLLLLVFASTKLSAQSEMQLAEAFLKSVKDMNFSLLQPWLGANADKIKGKWKQVIENGHRKGFDIKLVKIKNILPGAQIPNMPLKSIIVVYEYDGKEWDDLFLMITVDKKIKLVEIPLTTYMFALDEERRGKNIKDAEKN